MNRNQHGQQMLPAERFGEEDQAGKVQRQSGHHDGAGQDPLEVLDQQMWATLTLKGDVTQAAKQIEEKKSFRFRLLSPYASVTPCSGLT